MMQETSACEVFLPSQSIFESLSASNAQIIDKMVWLIPMTEKHIRVLKAIPLIYNTVSTLMIAL